MNREILGDIRARAAAGRPMTVVQAVALFDHLAGLGNIDFNSTATACYARAHLMCREMQNLGIAPQKAWAFEGEDHLSVTHASGVINPYWFHVMPSIPVEMPDGSVQAMVFEPSVYNGPVAVAEWARQMGAMADNVSVLPLGTAPLGGEGDYTPDDSRGTKKVVGKKTSDEADIHATAHMDYIRQNMIDSGMDMSAQRIVYSTEARDMAGKILGRDLPQEGSGWISLPLHREKLRAAQDVDPDTPSPLPPSGNKAFKTGVG